MKQIYVFLILIITILITSCSQEVEIHSFEGCVENDGVIMESYPRQCKINDLVFTENLENNDNKICTTEYDPVCGEIEFDCEDTTCETIKKTFPNKCEAQKVGAKNIQEGECPETLDPEDVCLSFDGKWINGFNECEGMPKEQCLNLGGEFNSCASACRNDPNAEICTLQCVQVCKFD